MVRVTETMAHQVTSRDIVETLLAVGFNWSHFDAARLSNTSGSMQGFGAAF